MKTIKAKILALNFTTVVVVILVFLSIVFIQKRQVEEKIDVQLQQLIDSNISTVSRDIYLQLETLHEILSAEVNNSLKVANSVMNGIGAVTLDSGSRVEWDAINQYTKAVTKIQLPRMMVGDRWLGQNRDMANPSPVVDEVKNMLGGTATIFQRMNEAGDMLRVCTNVEKLDGTRAIGTFIPAVNPDGKANPVIKTIMEGKTFRGRAFVVNAWYLTAYEPIYNEAKEIIGVLYFGIRQEKSAALRQGIIKTRVGKTGYVYVINAKGKTKGHYLISKDGKRDGENIYNAKDSDGRLFIQAIVSKALKLKGNQVAFERYPWQNEGEARPRWKKVAVSYFEPWDWVIGAGTYEDDFSELKLQVASTVNGIVYWSLAASLILLLVIFLVSVYLSKKMTGSLIKMKTLVTDIAEGEGDLTKRVTVDSRDEIQEVGDGFNTFVEKLQKLIAQIKEATLEIYNETEEINAESQDLAERTNEQAASLTETSTTLEQFTGSVKQNTDNSEQADEMLESLNRQIKEKNKLMANVTETMTTIHQSSQRIDNIVNVINDISFQTNLLALNAAVEAARAGEAGRGFAVVASEVRNLAQKTAESSKSIQEIVTGNVEATQRGMELVKETSEFFEEIANIMDNVVAIITDIANTSKQQNTGIDQINEAVVHLDDVSSQNLALVEELNAASRTMRSNTKHLQELVARFKVKS